MPGLRTWEQLLFTKKTVRSPQIKDTHQRRAADFMLEDRLRESDESRRVPKMTNLGPADFVTAPNEVCERFRETYAKITSNEETWPNAVEKRWI